VLYVSTHQFPFYPGTGAADEVGTGDGAGFTVNVPLEVGATDADYDIVYRDIVAPVVSEFAPQLLLVSAGFDAHERDPLAGMRMTERGYGSVVRRLMQVAPDGAVGFVTEGGYDLGALRSCLDEAFDAIRADRSAASSAPDVDLAGAPRAARALAAVRKVQKPFWRGI